MRSIHTICLMFSAFLLLASCGVDQVVKPADDALSGVTDDVQVALDTADATAEIAADVTSGSDAGDAVEGTDAIAPGDAATPDTADDVAAGSDALTSSDGVDAADVAAPDDATPVGDDTGADGTAEDAGMDAAAGDTALVDATNADAAEPDINPVDVADAALDTNDGSLSDTWGPCSSGVTCEDGDPCTVDFCWDVSCKHVAIVGCTGALLPCDALHPCAAGAGVCDLTRNACVPCNTAADCGPGYACQQNACMPATPCKSDLACKSAGQVCHKTDGVCVDCVVDGDCGKGNRCNGSTCEPAIACVSSKDCTAVCDFNGGFCVDCVDAADCTNGQACAAWHKCVPVTCTTTACQGGAAFACTAGSWSYSVGSDCQDGNPCTLDTCATGVGCQQVPGTASCDDKNACTLGDACAAGMCTGSLQGCDDKNVCTADSCDSTSGCQHAPFAAPCDDGDPCTLFDFCQVSLCQGATMDCNDNNDCTADSCSGGTCQHTAIAGTCDDLNGCTVGDTCVTGQCAPGKVVDCQVDTKGCGNGVCQSTGSQTWICTAATQPDGTSCDADGNGCTVGDSCKGGACIAGPTLDCSSATSSDGCQIGTCQSLGATQNTCTAVPATAGTNCNADSNGCTSGDKCNAVGACVAGPVIDCAVDPAFCVTGVCKSTGVTSYTCAGGVAKTDGTACNGDNSGCTLDTCKGGKCVIGSAPDCSSVADKCDTGVCKVSDATSYTCVAAPITCDDGNVCTTDACQLPGGCVFTANTLPCTDNNVCTLSDVCANGKCTGGTSAVCNDKNACTADSCDSVKGCINAVLTCDDGDPCSVDSCDPIKGCLHSPLASCVTVGVPYVEPFNCGGAKGWTLGQSAESGLGWAVDGTPASPGYLSPSCSLNFNNGVDFQCTSPVDVAATSPVINTASLPAGTHLAMRFFSNGAYEVSTWDKLSVEITTDSGATWTELLDVAAPASLAWTLQTLDLTTYVGKALQIRFRFWTVDCVNNDTVGGFIDDFAVYTTNCGSSSVVSCDDKNACTSDACAMLTGQCTFTANTLPCNDSNLCTGPDVCQAGVCTGGATNCDDANACTLDACDATTGKCSHAAVAGGTVCDDGNPCTNNDACTGTTCVGGASPCNDNNSCTIDFCTNLNGAPSCSTKALPDLTPCDDGNACTSPDMCTTGTCSGPNTCGFTTLYSENFACGGKNGWTLQGVAKTALTWAVDATPATPGYYSPSCSLNFNDGTTYGSIVPAVAFATSPSFALPVTANACTLSLYSWADVGFFNGETRAIALLDAKTNTDLVTFGVTNGTDAKVWTPIQVDCMAALGHTVTVQLRFSDTAGPLPVQPTGAGWFVDDVLVVVGAP